MFLVNRFISKKEVLYIPLSILPKLLSWDEKIPS
jgi:hypothetical protein